MAQVYRVREINAHRLTSLEAAEEYETGTVWRAIAARRSYGHWEYLFDDPVLEGNIGRYVLVAAYRGAERITLHRLGTVRDVLDKGAWVPMKGTKALSREKRWTTLDDFGRD